MGGYQIEHVVLTLEWDGSDLSGVTATFLDGEARKLAEERTVRSGWVTRQEMVLAALTPVLRGGGAGTL